LNDFTKKSDMTTSPRRLHPARADAPLVHHPKEAKDHPQRRWLECPAKGRKGVSPSVRERLRLLPGAKHPIGNNQSNVVTGFGSRVSITQDLIVIRLIWFGFQIFLLLVAALQFVTIVVQEHGLLCHG
jgi:hypothetical protein